MNTLKNINFFHSFFPVIILGFVGLIQNVNHNTDEQNEVKKYLFVPVSLSPPSDFDGINMALDTKKTRKNEAWRVYCDRTSYDGINTYTSPGGASFTKLIYKEKYYVVEETKNWVRLAKGELDGRGQFVNQGQDYGWIEKINVLLWGEGLIDQHTRIHKKAFLLNKLDDLDSILKKDNRRIVNIYSSPEGNEIVHQTQLYDFYFILKKQSGRYLLATEVEFTSGDPIIGWVNSNQCEDWNTRLCLEPNFDNDAFNERKSDNSKRFILYHRESAAKNHAQSGFITVDEGVIAWDNDPARTDYSNDNSVKYNANDRRFSGNVMRFPKFDPNSGSENSNPIFWRTGMIGDIYLTDTGEKIDEGELIDTKNKLDIMTSQIKHFNLVFVVEATSDMAEYKSEIAEGLRKLFKSLKNDIENVQKLQVALVLYKDSNTDITKAVKTIPLTGNIEKICSAINSLSFSNAEGDTDPFTILNYALLEGMGNTDLSNPDKATNIIINIAKNTDFSGSYFRGDGIDEKYKINSSKVNELMLRMRCHSFFIQPERTNVRSQEKYTSISKDCMLENANRRYRQYQKVLASIDPDKIIGNPKIIPENEEADTYATTNCSVKNYYHHARGESALYHCLSDQLRFEIGNIFKELKTTFAILDGIIGADKIPPPPQKESPSIGTFIGMADIISRANIEPDLLKILKNERVQLFTEVHLPRRPNKSRYESYKFVLFMPEKDLESFKDFLRKVVISKEKSVPEMRKSLKSALINLIQSFTNGRIGESEAGQMTIEELHNLIIGLEDSGVQLSNEWDIQIEHIDNSRKVSDTKILELTNKYRLVNDNIDDILIQGRSYEYAYKTDLNTYYWIPLDLVF